MAQAFFNPESKFGGFEGWEIQQSNPTTGKDRAQALGADGDEIASKLHNTKTSITENFVAVEDGAVIPSVGAIAGGYHIDSISVTLSNTGFATMSVTGHKHGSTVHPACRTYTGTLATVAAIFGAPATVPCATIPTGAGVRSVTYALAVNHIDELNNVGEFLAGDNYDGNETYTIELCDNGVLTAKDGWDETSIGGGQGNTAAETATGTFVKHLAHNAA